MDSTLSCPVQSQQFLTYVKLTKQLHRAAKWLKYDKNLQRVVQKFYDYSNCMDYLKAVGTMTMLWINFYILILYSINIFL